MNENLSYGSNVPHGWISTNVDESTHVWEWTPHENDHMDELTTCVIEYHINDMDEFDHIVVVGNMEEITFDENNRYG